MALCALVVLAERILRLGFPLYRWGAVATSSFENICQMRDHLRKSLAPFEISPIFIRRHLVLYCKVKSRPHYPGEILKTGVFTPKPHQMLSSTLRDFRENTMLQPQRSNGS